jgi:DNA-binding HxlR family transcriptional regulator
MLGKDYSEQDCSLARALEVVGERWTLLVIRDAFYGVRRFNDFQAHLDIPKAVLADRLNGLVGDGLLERVPDSEHAGRHLYELTGRGRDLWPVLYGLITWGASGPAGNSRTFRHAACNSELDARGFCPRCQVVPPPEDVVIEPKRGRRRRRTDPVAIALNSPHRLLEPLQT